jgi:hypothetical protein
VDLAGLYEDLHPEVVLFLQDGDDLPWREMAEEVLCGDPGLVQDVLHHLGEVALAAGWVVRIEGLVGGFLGHLILGQVSPLRLGTTKSSPDQYPWPK